MNLPDADKWIREAASAAEELINSKQYKLLNTGEAEKDYRKLFTAENRTGVRSIWMRLFGHRCMMPNFVVGMM